MDYTNLIFGVFGFSIYGFVLSLIKIRKLQKEISSLEDLIDEVNRELLERDRLINKRIDGEIDRTNRISAEDIKFTLSQIDKINKSILELRNEFSDKLTSGVEVRNALDKINKVESDLEDFVKMYRNQ
jgi:uncharacterized protein Yka (UPF0111/DUF47 family)